MAYYAQSAIADERDVSTAVAYAGLYRWGNPRTVALSMAEYAAEVQAHRPRDAWPTKRPSDSRTSKTSEDSRQCGEVRMARRTKAGGAGHGLGPTDPPNDRRVIRRKFRT